jgi:hypothetical protein
LSARIWRKAFKVRLVLKKQSMQGAEQSPRSKVKAKAQYDFNSEIFKSQICQKLGLRSQIFTKTSVLKKYIDKLVCLE